MRPRQIAPLALILALTIGGFIAARALAEQGARRQSEHLAEVAAAQIRGRIAQAAALAESLRRFMLASGGTGVTSDQFARNAFDWLSPADLSAAAWVERVPDSRRAAYERRIGDPIVTPDERHSVVPVGLDSSYLPATVVSGFPPLDVPGIDLSREPGMFEALDRATRVDGIAATLPTGPRAGVNGFYLVAPASNLVEGALHPGYVVLFVSDPSIDATADARGVQLAVGGRGSNNRPSVKTVRASFTQAGQRFDVIVPQESVGGAAAIPWVILVAGLVLAGFTAALGVNAARRARAQAELDRIFRLSSDMIVVADFEGHFTRVNPAVEQVLGYRPEEFLAKPYLELVHPEDREKTAAEAATIARGKKTSSFENRYVHKDGSYRLLDWTTTPVVEDRLMYGVARDVTERRAAESERERLAEEQAALRRVATLVAQGASPSAVLDAVAAEMELVLRADGVTLSRYEPDEELVVVAHRGSDPQRVPPGTRASHRGENVTSLVRRSERAARMEHREGGHGAIAELARSAGVRASVGAPIVVDGSLWGVAIANWRGKESPPVDTEERMVEFAQLLDTAIANADSRDQLTASRARLVTEGDEARRRVVRDLHDGAQQRLLHTILTLKLARRALRARDKEAESLVDEALQQAEQGNAELRELAHGLLPVVITQGGLRAGVETVVSRLDLPVEVDVPAQRFPTEIEASAYFIVAEALTNVVKHSHAGHAEVVASVEDGTLQVEVRDDGIGGADPAGHGLLGMGDRVAALGGRLQIESPVGGGTLVSARLPVRDGTESGHTS